VSEPRERVAELTALLLDELRPDLLGLYLFGSLAAGGFVEGRSDVDLFAVVEDAVDENRLARLERLHADFAAAHPEWRERVEVGYVDRGVLQTFAAEPAGTIAVISPGEPLHITEPQRGWVLNWHGVCTQGEVLYGSPPLELGPALSESDYRRVVAAQLAAWQKEIRAAAWVGYVPAAEGYAVVSICRALYALETGGQTTKEAAAAWAAERFPEWAGFIRDALAKHRADPAGPRAATIRFVDFAVETAEG
jgi:Aminoglycoside adenylyltransferase, C-terminal domain/Nucleotidyltransferase domain